MEPRRQQLPAFDPKATPSGVGDMRFGGGRRPSMAPMAMAEDKKPANMRRIRNRTELIFGGIFALVAAAMVLGAMSIALPSLGLYDRSSPDEQAAATDPTEAPAAEQPAEELQGGVKVRKGLKK